MIIAKAILSGNLITGIKKYSKINKYVCFKKLEKKQFNLKANGIIEINKLEHKSI